MKYCIIQLLPVYEPKIDGDMLGKDWKVLWWGESFDECDKWFLHFKNEVKLRDIHLMINYAEIQMKEQKDKIRETIKRLTQAR